MPRTLKLLTLALLLSAPLGLDQGARAESVSPPSALKDERKLDTLDYPATPEAILAQIDKSSAARVIGELFSHGEYFQKLLDGIESGRADWLDVAARLTPAADGAFGESLFPAIEAAIITNPEKVLQIWKDAGFPCECGTRWPEFGGADCITLEHFN